MTETFVTNRKIDILYAVLTPLGLISFAILAKLGYCGSDFAESYVFSTELILVMLSSVLPLLRISRRFIAPYWFICTVTAILYVHGTAMYVGTYQTIPHWDVFAHISATMVVTMIVFLGLTVIQAYTTCVELGKKTFLFMVFIIGFAFGNVWEMFEWFVDNFFGYTYMSYSVFDTLGDVLSDVIGSLTMTLLAAIVLYRSTPKEIVAPLNIDRIMTILGGKWDRKCGKKD